MSLPPSALLLLLLLLPPPPPRQILPCAVERPRTRRNI
jgi:hypothetical protein